ncbi:unnamed protein product [Penicillium nalgiovense]|uniref:Uncharacterized protein n=1 Tax=Penicillium nalgiovense TaxID=60175 RepID=A0A9W4HVZ4_PENNA|nr:unnamed protein product [Penicillium nalgiovense]CAG8092609.1 unnamed protein product [Penicillium nalgiovense]CAG8095459.1 unnamed protein product [Penicillium nalgiovense]CAG8098677.1 unnamed protein product [Penicillium nalgiovense]CAG8138345.1 unnamed protein product [Penicillium nalgiovense]
MDSANTSPDKEKEGEQQPCELPILSDRDNNLESSDHVPPLPSPSQHEEVTRRTLATEPFQPILQVLADLERDDPKFAFPAARLVGLYRRLWGSCVSKHVDGQKLRQSNQTLKEAETHLRKERDGLQLRHDKQLARLRFFEQALESSRERLTSLLDDWKYPYSPNLTGLRDVAREE